MKLLAAVLLCAVACVPPPASSNQGTSGGGAGVRERQVTTTGGGGGPACANADFTCLEGCQDEPCMRRCLGDGCYDCLAAFYSCGNARSCNGDLPCMQKACPGECAACFGNGCGGGGQPAGGGTAGGGGGAAADTGVVGTWRGGSNAYYGDLTDGGGAVTGQESAGHAYQITFDASGRYELRELRISRGRMINCRAYHVRVGQAALSGTSLRLVDQSYTVTRKSLGSPGCRGPDGTSQESPATTDHVVSGANGQMYWWQPGNANSGDPRAADYTFQKQ